jgi:hypothetical protein
MEKAKAKRVKKVSDTKATKPGERLMLDTTGPFAASLGGSRYDIQICDEFTNMDWVRSRAKKSAVPKIFGELVRFLKGKGIEVKYLRCDNAGEHQDKLKEICDTEGIQMEFTPPGTPQYNGKRERKIAINRMRALASMFNCKLTEEGRKSLRAEAVQYAAITSNLLVTPNQKEPPVEAFFKTKSKLQLKHLMEFGRIGYVTIKQKIKDKHKAKSFPAIFVGYAQNHPPDTYRMLNPATDKVIETRDVRWADWKPRDPSKLLSKYQNKPDIQKKIPAPGLENIFSPDDEDDDDKDLPALETGRKPTEDKPKENKEPAPRYNTRGASKKVSFANPTPTERNARLERELARLGDHNTPPDNGNNNNGSEQDEETQRNTAEQTVDAIFAVEGNERFVFTGELTTDPGEPKTLREALTGSNKDKWIPSVKAEIENFKSRGAWKEISRDEVEKLGRRPIPTKTVFKIKTEQDHSLRYKTRIVSKGFKAIPGVDYTETSSPVATDTSVRLVIALSLYHIGHEEELLGIDNDEWVLEMFDVEAAFLNSKMGKSRMFIEIPEAEVLLGMRTKEEASRLAYELVMSMYGNCDSALLFFKTYREILVDKMGLQQCKSDPCVFFKRNGDGNLVLLLCSHIDDSLIGGMKKEIESFYTQFEKYLKIERLGKLKKHLGVWWDWGKDENGDATLTASMDKMIEDIILQFEQQRGKGAKKAATPGFPGTCLEKLQESEEQVDIDGYRSIVGKILYLMTKIGPTLANAARELSAHMSNPGERHWKALERFVGYLSNIPREKWSITFLRPIDKRAYHYSDNGYQLTKEDSMSTNGCLETIGGTILGWHSKKAAIVALSTSEAEYIAYGLVAQSMVFLQELMGEIFGTVEKPGIIFEDNMGCIYLIKNPTTSARTKHIRVRYHFVRDLREEGSIEPVFCSSEQMLADGMTKNQPEKLFIEHRDVLHSGNLPVRREDVKDLLDPSDGQTKSVRVADCIYSVTGINGSASLEPPDEGSTRGSWHFGSHRKSHGSTYIYETNTDGHSSHAVCKVDTGDSLQRHDTFSKTKGDISSDTREEEPIQSVVLTKVNSNWIKMEEKTPMTTEFGEAESAEVERSSNHSLF